MPLLHRGVLCRVRRRSCRAQALGARARSCLPSFSCARPPGGQGWPLGVGQVHLRNQRLGLQAPSRWCLRGPTPTSAPPLGCRLRGVLEDGPRLLHGRGEGRVLRAEGIADLAVVKCPYFPAVSLRAPEDVLSSAGKHARLARVLLYSLVAWAVVVDLAHLVIYASDSGDHRVRRFLTDNGKEANVFLETPAEQALLDLRSHLPHAFVTLRGLLALAVHLHHGEAWGLLVEVDANLLL
mmetsp:Transcript_960/g.3174  ORF Transcript_960/g.3174 Transcript_960/m.3174 type:complete len:238 (+) Transcript_960:255-968(+)